MQDALLLIEIQNDYFPGGKMELVDPISAANNARRLLQHFRNAKLPVIHVQHLSTHAGATHLLPGTEGAEFNEAVLPMEGEPVVVKHLPNGFYQTDLLGILRKLQVKNLAVAGMMTHRSIDSTVRTAREHGFDVYLYGDACAARDLMLDGERVAARDVQTAFLAALHWKFALVVRTDDIDD